MRSGILLLLSAALSLASPAAARAFDLTDYGYGATMGDLLYLERLNRSVRFDPEAKIQDDWGGRYARIEVVELASVESRYAAFVDDERRRVDVAIRGTVNLRNAAFDVEFMKRRSELLGIYLHSGFEKAANALFEDLKPRIPEGYSLRVAGHSLGAAEAIIAGMLLSREGYRVELVLASAPPKVTDAEGWARFSSLPVIRLAGPYDPVPFLPPKGPIYGHDPYIQGGRVVFILDGAKFTLMDGSFFDGPPDEVMKVFAEGRHFKVREHLLPAYLARLEPKVAGLEYVSSAAWENYAQTFAGY
jgi:hypothetical protein